MTLKKGLPVYQLQINAEDEESGVNFVALVDNPAIECNWLAFNKYEENTVQRFSADEEKRIISGPLMVADMPIYRKDKYGEYYVKFDSQAINQIVLKFFKNQNTGAVNKMHDPSQLVDGVYMFESFVINSQRMPAPKGFEDLPDGSWFGSYKVDNEAVWNEIKAGTFKGFSVEGMFIPERTGDVVEAAMLALIEAVINT